MSAGRTLALTIAAAALLMTFSAAAAAQNGAARLEGTFALSGRVTVAVHIKAEHRGQHVARVWSFTPLCSTGACADVLLTRQRAGGTDTLTLHSVSPGNYRGQSAFAAPLGCDGQLKPVGETARFTITVHVAAAAGSSDGLIATGISATYTDRVRSNNTSCVFPPSHDAAVYRGTLQTMTPTTVGPATSASVSTAARRISRARRALSGLSPAGS